MHIPPGPIGVGLFLVAVLAAVAHFKLAVRIPTKASATVFTVAALAYLVTGIGLRLHEDEPEPLTVGDIVRPDLTGTVATDATLESWQAAFEEYGFTWPYGDLEQEERPTGLLSFDDEFTGYVEGTVEENWLQLTAIVGYEGDDIAWFTCYAAGPDTLGIEVEFLQDCWTAAQVPGQDDAAVREWIASAAADTAAADGFGYSILEGCLVNLAIVSPESHPNYANTQLTVSDSEECP
ncbi:hypothetical protein AB0A73_28625 [Glycomyces sp. NPDC047369]